MIITLKEFGFVDCEIATHERFADAVCDVNYKMFVVNAGEDFGGDFVRLEQMVKVGAGVVLAIFAVAIWH